jgi:hypothetical protein
MYHIYANDKEGPVGIALRSFVQSTGVQGSMDDKTFATFYASLFVVVSGILMLPEFFGGAWNPFYAPIHAVKSLTASSLSSIPAKPSKASNATAPEQDTDSDMTDEEPSSTRSSKRRKPKKKKAN